MSEFLRQIRIKDLLSIHDVQVDLRPLNVVIGPNGSGKTNLLKCVSLLLSLPRSLRDTLIAGGGVAAWIRMGASGPRVASLECLLDAELTGLARYRLSFASVQHALAIQEESLVSDSRPDLWYFNRRAGQLDVAGIAALNGVSVKPDESVLRFGAPGREDAIGKVAAPLERSEVYWEFDTGRHSPIRTGSVPGGTKTLTGDGSNLPVVLNEIYGRNGLTAVDSYLTRFCDRFTGVKALISGAAFLTHVKERGLSDPVPANLLSDGTLKFLCILAICFNPDPPAIVCIEEPEAGLHPDAVRVLGDVLREASNRMQIIVTTHSEALVSALSDEPEAILVCEHTVDGGSQFRRFTRAEIEGWLDRYSLGEIWQKGIIGGNPW